MVGEGIEPEVLTKTALAELLGVSGARVSHLVAKGLPVRPDGKLDRAEALAWVEANVDPTRRRGPGRQAAPGGGLTAVKTEREAAQARLLQLQYEVRVGNLVDRNAAEAAIFARARLERDAHLSWVVRAAPAIADALGVDSDAVFRALDAQMRRHLEDLAETPLPVLAHADERR